jgi:SUKH-3 immunity protein/YwqJ-like deaminase
MFAPQQTMSMHTVLALGTLVGAPARYVVGRTAENIGGEALITRADAELLVNSWAEAAAERAGGGDWVGMLEEYDFGYVGWVKQPPEVRPEPGSGVRSVIDRDTGDVIPWGSIPAPMVADNYRAGRPPIAVSTVDPVMRVREQARPGLKMNTAASITLSFDRRMRTAYGARGDYDLNHHPVVREFLAAQPPGHMSRGADRHADMILISDVLHAHDAFSGAPTTLETARRIIRGVQRFTTVRIRPPEAGSGGRAWQCYTCIAAWVHIGLYDDRILAAYRPRGATVVKCIPRDDLPPELLALGPDYEDDSEPGQPVSKWDERWLRQNGRPLIRAKLEMMRKYFRVTTSVGSVPGQVHRVEGVYVRPNFTPLYDGLATEFGRRFGLQAYGIGSENGGEAVYVGDELGRVFALDQGGEWYLGGSIDEALVTAVYGRHQPKVRADGTW